MAKETKRAARVLRFIVKSSVRNESAVCKLLEQLKEIKDKYESNARTVCGSREGTCKREQRAMTILSILRLRLESSRIRGFR